MGNPHMTDTIEDVGTNALEPTSAPVEAVIEAPEAVIEEAPETVAETSQTADPEPKPHHLKGRTPWYMERINEETNKRRLIEEQLAQERREKTEARALLERMQAGDKDTPRARTEEPTDIDALVDARAEQKLFNADCNAVAERGQLDIPDFNDKLALLRSIGVVNDDFLKDIFAVDKGEAHKILATLADQPEQANLMTRMDSRRRIAALTRMNMAEAVKPVAPAAPVRSGVSKVPPPKPVVDAVSDNLGEMDLANDKLDDATWSKMWDKKFKRRA